MPMGKKKRRKCWNVSCACDGAIYPCPSYMITKRKTCCCNAVKSLMMRHKAGCLALKTVSFAIKCLSIWLNVVTIK